MAEVIFKAVGNVRVREFSIGFDLKTWDFVIYEDGYPVAVLQPDQSASLRNVILETSTEKSIG